MPAMRFVLLGAIGLAFGAITPPATAQSTAASGSVIVVPVVAQTVSYTSEVFVQNPNPAPITVDVDFYVGGDSTPTAGLVTCTSLTVPANETVSFTLASKCTLSAGSHFGMLILADAAAQKTDVFFAYTRSQATGGNGFSVEGFPIGAFSGAPANVVGLKRQAAAPVYQTNCFVAALGEAIDYQVVLRDGTTGALIGNPLTGTLQPFEEIRYLKVFEKAGAQPGDYSNVRANFTVTTADLTPGQPAFVGFCTVQENTYFSADFRIAKSIDAKNQREQRVACIGQDECGLGNPVSGTQAETIADATQRNVYSMIITQPDYVRCDLVAASGDLGKLQMRLRGPSDPFGTVVFPSSPPFDSGGAGKTTFYVYTGPRNAATIGTLGVATRWFIDVETIDTSTPVPIDFGITCSSGNGTEVPWFRGRAAYASF